MQSVTAGRVVDLHTELQRIKHRVPDCRCLFGIFGPELHCDYGLKVSAATETKASTRLSLFLLSIDKDRLDPGDFNIAVSRLMNLASCLDIAVVTSNRCRNQITKRQSAPVNVR